MYTNVAGIIPGLVDEQLIVVGKKNELIVGREVVESYSVLVRLVPATDHNQLHEGVASRRLVDPVIVHVEHLSNRYPDFDVSSIVFPEG